LRDNRFRYSNRPTEVEAYAHAVKEARRLGMTDKEIFEYLRMDNMSEDDVKALADAVNVKP
jgi:DNA topoisomerase VI subunit A